MTEPTSPAKPVRLPNLDQFHEFAAEILSTLYRNFPVRVPIDALGLTGDQEPDPSAALGTEEAERRRRFEVALATVAWLRDEGYIVAPWCGHHRFDGCVLTAKGLRALLRVPDRLAPDRTVGERLVAATEDRYCWTGPEVVRAALGLGSSA